MSDAPLGLRELKKQRTREQISDAAMSLFLTRGFDVVPVAAVARAAEVSEATVFNYFGTKEDLVFDRLDLFWTDLVDAVDTRGARGVVDVVEEFLLARPPSARTPEQTESLAAISRMISTSPALLARERASYDRAAAALAEVIERTTDLGADSPAAAQLILGVHRSLVAHTREQVLAGVGGKALSRGVAERIRSGYAMVRSGVGC